MSFIKDLQNKFHDFIHSSEAIGADFIHALLTSITQNGGKILIDAATAAVKAAETAGGSGGDKFKAAFTAVVAILEAESLPVVQMAINGAIEAAVANLKAKNV